MKYRPVFISLAFILFFVGVGCDSKNKIEQESSINDSLVENIIKDNNDLDEDLKDVLLIEESLEVTEEVVEEEKNDEDDVVIPQIQRFDMIAKQWEFEPGVIEVNQGDTVQINITSIDVEHGFKISEFGVDKLLRPGETANIEFITDKKGTFTFSCNVFCGSGHGKMKGTLLVK